MASATAVSSLLGNALLFHQNNRRVHVTSRALKKEVLAEGASKKQVQSKKSASSGNGGKKKAAAKKNNEILADWIQKADHHLITLDLAGVPEENVKVTTGQRSLTVTAIRPVVPEESHEAEGFEDGATKLHSKERWEGCASRTFVFPDNVKLGGNDVEASMDKGLLTLTIPAIPPQEKVITIKLAS